jgi:hypothetical protein
MTPPPARLAWILYACHSVESIDVTLTISGDGVA